MQTIFTLLTIHLFRQSVAPAQHFLFFFRDTFFFFFFVNQLCRFVLIDDDRFLEFPFRITFLFFTDV